MQAEDRIKRVLIVGGGSAGWLSAGVLAATLRRRGLGEVCITVVESPDVPSIGVGEGTWPSMRSTLQAIGISETTFIRHCHATFKQGTCFQDWCGTGAADRYLHPFTVPQRFHERNPVPDWLAMANVPFWEAVSAQGRLAPLGLAPKAISTPEYGFFLNYGYHLDAGRFAELLREHCVQQLGVRHEIATVSAVSATPEGDISALQLADGRALAGDLFIDCSGQRSLLLHGHYGVPLQSCAPVLLNDTALAVQVPYTDPEQPVACYTLSSARDAGWVWDIGLSHRRGVGYVYSSAHSSEEEAARVLQAYLRSTGALEPLPEPRRIDFKPGYRQRFWERNCVAIGLSAGFIEPLEASALVLVELSARLLAEDFPVHRGLVPVLRRRFNQTFTRHWAMIVDFLKLHYVLSQREGAYWQAQRAPDSVPQTLADRLALWRYRPPWHQDAVAADDMFPPASFQYILYGMGFGTSGLNAQALPGEARQRAARAAELAREVDALSARLRRTLPTHRALLQKLQQHALPTI